MRLPACIVCGEAIGGESTAWTHSQCAAGEGWDLTVPFTDWPEWARALKRDEQRQREGECERIDAGIDVLLFSEMGDSAFRGDTWEVGIGWNGYRAWEGF